MYELRDRILQLQKLCHPDPYPGNGIGGTYNGAPPQNNDEIAEAVANSTKQLIPTNNQDEYVNPDIDAPNPNDLNETLEDIQARYNAEISQFMGGGPEQPSPIQKQVRVFDDREYYNNFPRLNASSLGTNDLFEMYKRNNFKILS